jgi:hypothetical protein
MLGKYTRIALFYFMLAAIFGVLLRSFSILDTSVNYRYIVHTHSHIALLGWVYVALTILLYRLYLGKLEFDKRFRRIFWFMQVTLVGMLLTFPFMGYALFSIIFSTLFLFGSYWFAWFFFKNVPSTLKKTNSYKCIRVALLYLILSSLGPWTLGAIMNTLGAESIWYRLAIYFYLHFLYNGWMIMALVGIFLFILENRHVKISDKTSKCFFRCINPGILLSFFLSTLFANPSILFIVLGGVGAVLQLIAFAILCGAFTKEKEKLKTIYLPFQNGLLKTITVLLAVKMILQSITAIPYFANLAATYLDFTIGYLHWTFLGVVSIGLFLFIDFVKLMYISKNAYFFYLTGFVITEALIFYKGIAAWQNLVLFDGFFEVLAVGSALIPIALVVMLWNNLKPTTAEM